MKSIVTVLTVASILLSAFVSTYSIRSVRAVGVIYIRADGSVDPPTAPILNEGNVYYFRSDIFDSIVVERHGVTIDGAGFTLRGPSNGSGLMWSGIHNVTVQNLVIEDFVYGLYLEASVGSRIVGNTIVANYYYGIFGVASSGNSILGNLIAGSGYGIVLANTSGYNTISGNTIANNTRGLGLYVSSGNWIFHNNFIVNGLQAFSEASGNEWDDGYPSGGNYWSDYLGADVYSGPGQNVPGGDGIGDTPYVIATDTTDNYPLMGTFGPNTPPGENVTVYPTDDVCLTFDSINEEGLTTVEKPGTGPALPPGFTAMQYYVIDTTAGYAGNISIKIIYPMLPGMLGDAPLQESWHLLQCVLLAGDVDEDFDVDIFDLVRLASIYGVSAPDPRYTPQCDLDHDGDIDIFDLVLMASSYGKPWNPATGWTDITNRVDESNNSIFGVTRHLSIFGVTKHG